MKGSLRGVILDRPDGGENRLGEGPREYSVGAQAECMAETANTPVDDDRIGEEVGVFHRVPQRGADFEFQLADDTLGIDGKPSPMLVEQHIVVVQVGRTLR